MAGATLFCCESVIASESFIQGGPFGLPRTGPASNSAVRIRMVVLPWRPRPMDMRLELRP